MGGTFIALKSNYEEELEKAMPTIKKLNSTLGVVSNFELPYENSKRTIISFFVKDVVDEKYPRPYDQIIKKELK